MIEYLNTLTEAAANNASDVDWSASNPSAMDTSGDNPSAMDTSGDNSSVDDTSAMDTSADNHVILSDRNRITQYLQSYNRELSKSNRLSIKCRRNVHSILSLLRNGNSSIQIDDNNNVIIEKGNLTDREHSLLKDTVQTVRSQYWSTLNAADRVETNKGLLSMKGYNISTLKSNKEAKVLRRMEKIKNEFPCSEVLTIDAILK